MKKGVLHFAHSFFGLQSQRDNEAKIAQTVRGIFMTNNRYYGKMIAETG